MKVVAELERILKRAIILRDIAGEDIFNTGKYRSRGADMELICYNGHAWSKDLPDQGSPLLRGRHLAGDRSNYLQRNLSGVDVCKDGHECRLLVYQFVQQNTRRSRKTSSDVMD